MSGKSNEIDTGALTKLQQALDWAYSHAVKGMPGVSGAEALAGDFQSKHLNNEAAIDALIKWQWINAGTAGFVTGLGGLITLPIAVPINLGVVLVIQLRMIQAIAHLRGHDLNSDSVKILACVCLVGAKGVDMLKASGIIIGKKATEQAFKKIPGALIIKLNKAVGFRLLTKAGTRGVVNLPKLIPVVGGLVSGAIDAGTTRAIGGAAKRIFTAIPSDKS